MLIMRPLSFLNIMMLAGCFIFGNCYVQADSIDVSGTVTGTWGADTVWVVDNLLVPDGETLTIDPGVWIAFKGHYQVVVRGTVHAIGTADQWIEFTVSDTTGFADTLSVIGGWGGFFYEHLDPDTDSSLFAYCRFDHGKTALTGDTIHYYGGAFRIFDFHKIRFSHCHFEHNRAFRWGGGLFLKNASIKIQHCTFTDNRSGRLDLPYGYGGGLCVVSASPVVQNNHFVENRSTGVGGGASFEYSDPEVSHNLFQGNYSGLGGALCYLRTIPQNPCSNNLIIENEARFFGGGIAVLRANTIFVNNTLANNFAVYGGAYYCNDSAFPSNYNCLFYNNFAYEGEEVYIWDIRSAPDFYYCNVPGDTSGFAGSGGHEGYHGTYQNNLDTVADFVEDGLHPFQLKHTSPMRDAGTVDTSGLLIPLLDYGGNPRIYNHRIDIGAYEWNPGPGISENIRSNQRLTLFPNPAKEMVTLSFVLTKESTIRYAIYSLKGSLLQEGSEISLKAGKHSLSIDLYFASNQPVTNEPCLVVLTTNAGTSGSLLFINQDQ
jgi:hypothetical protein